MSSNGEVDSLTVHEPVETNGEKNEVQTLSTNTIENTLLTQNIETEQTEIIQNNTIEENVPLNTSTKSVPNSQADYPSGFASPDTLSLHSDEHKLEVIFEYSNKANMKRFSIYSKKIVKVNVKE